MLSMKRLAPTFGIIAVMLWGASFTAGKLAYLQMGTFDMLFMRMGISAIIVLPALIYFIKKNGLPSSYDFLVLSAISFLGFVACLAFQFLGLKYIDASVASIAVGIEGSFTMVLAYIILKQKPTKSNWLVGLMALIGLIIVVGIPESAKIMGVTFILIANFCAGLAIIINKPLFRTMGAIEIACWTVVLGFLFVSFGTPWFGGVPEVAHYTMQTWTALLVLSLGATVIAYILYTICLQYLSATRTAQFIVIEPLIGVLAGVVILGDSFGVNILIGTSLVAGAIFINSLVDDGNG